MSPRNRTVAPPRGMEGYLSRIARAISRNWGTTVVFSGTECCTDGRQIRIPYNAERLDEDTKRLIHSDLDHEVCHNAEEVVAQEARRVTPITLMNQQGNRTVKMLFNVFEDIRIENKYSAEYPGMAENLRAGNEHAADEWNRRVRKGEKQSNFWHALGCAIIYRGRGIDPECTPEMLEWLDVVKPEIDDCSGMVWAEDSLDLAKRVYEKIRHAAEKAKREQGPKSGEQGPKSGEQGPKSGEQGPKSGEQGKGTGKDERPVPSVTPDQAALPLNQEAEVADLQTLVKDDIRFEAEQDAAHGYVPHPDCLSSDRWDKPAGRNVDVYSDSNQLLPIGKRASLEDYQEALEGVREQVGALRSKTQNIIRIMANSRLVGEQEAGTLDSASLYTLRFGNRDVFTQLRKGRTLDTAVSIMVDLSGSMGNRTRINDKGMRSKSYYAHRMLIALCETFDKLGVPFEVIGFYNPGKLSDRVPVGSAMLNRSPIQYLIFKEFGEKLRRCRARFTEVTGQPGDNADGEAFIAIARRLAVQPQERKLMFVISDGQPRTSGIPAGRLQAHLKEQVKIVTSAGIDVFAIGVCTDAVRQFYNKSTGAESIVVNDLDKLAVEVYKVMRERLLKGMRRAA